MAPGERDAADHPAVTALLAVTPLWDGETVVDIETTDTTKWYAPGEPHDVNVPDTFTTPVFGDPTPIAARQAAAVLRWLAAEAARDEEFEMAGWLDAIEDEIKLRHPEAADAIEATR